MYNTEVTTTTDSKYLAADILTSMAHGEPHTPFSSGAFSYSSGVLNLSTPTLTPTSLANIEQTFLELQVPTVSHAGASRYTQSGFVPPVIDPAHSETYSEHGDWSPGSSTTGSDGPSGSRGKRDKNGTPYSILAKKYPSMRRRDLKNETVTQEEGERRRVRRERNAVAASKCRQRRSELTNVLQDETEALEDQKMSLESEITSLQQTKDQLEFLLEAHKHTCKKDLRRQLGNKTSVIVKHESLTDTLKRPNTLPIPTTMSDIGVPITTPSGVINTPAGIFSFGFEVDGSTGLTPITGVPSSCVPSCSRQHRTSSESSPDALSPKLISL